MNRCRMVAARLTREVSCLTVACLERYPTTARGHLIYPRWPDIHFNRGPLPCQVALWAVV
jgi:hypothetical protein